MNYKKIYDDLILKAKSQHRKKLKRTNPNFIYYERHHITPKSMGGTNEASNLVLLTAKEHFVAHKLLVEIYPNNKKLIFALHLMVFKNNSQQDRNYKISSREYERVKTIHSKKMSEYKIGKPGTPHTDEFKIMISKKLTGLKRSEETKNKLKNRKISKESRLKMSMSRIGLKPSEETRKKFSLRSKGSNNNMYGKGYLIKGERNGRFGKEVSEETRNKISKANKERSSPLKGKVNPNFAGSNNPMYNSKRFADKNPFYGKTHTEETKNKLRELAKNRFKNKIKCEFCGKESSIPNHKRWHGDNCKLKKIY